MNHALKQMQYRFAVIYERLSTYIDDNKLFMGAIGRGKMVLILDGNSLSSELRKSYANPSTNVRKEFVLLNPSFD